MQLARLRGARVIATASARHADFVVNLGAEQVIDYQTSRFEEHVKDVDVVFDTVGGETLERSWAVLKAAGRMVTIAASGAVAIAARYVFHLAGAWRRPQKEPPFLFAQLFVLALFIALTIVAAKRFRGETFRAA